MKYAQRFLAMLLCLLLSLGTFAPALGEGDASGEAAQEVSVEPVAEVEPPAADPPAVTNPPIVTNPPATNPPATEAPATEAPATEAPVTEAPATNPPATNPPATEAPVTEAPATEIPTTETPTTEAPATELPLTSESPFPSESPLPSESPQPSESPLAIDFTRSAAHSPAFVRGYAELDGECPGYAGPAPEAEALYILRGGVYYVLSRSGDGGADRLEAAFDGGEGELIAWIDADCLRPMSAEESQAFALARAAAEQPRFLQADPALPLDAPEYAPAAAAVLALADEASAAPELIVQQGEFVLGVGEKARIAASFSDGVERPVRYTSEDSSIASVTDDGALAGRKVGETYIQIAGEGGGAARVHVVVKAAPKKISLSAPRKTLGVGEQIQLSPGAPEGTATQFSFSSGKKSVASVDGSGVVTANARGSARITVRSFNGKKASVSLKVKSAPKSVSLNAPASMEMGVGESYKLVATLSKDSAGARAFRSSDENVARVDAASGLLEAVAPGIALITVETYNHKTASCEVRVYPAPAAASFAVPEVTIGRGETLAMPEVLLSGADGERSASSLKYATSRKNIVELTKNGKLKGKKAGSAVVTVTTYNGLSAQLSVKVENAPKKVNLSAPHKTLGVGEEMQLVASFPSRSASNALGFSSDNEAVVAVSAGGQVRAVAEGAARVSVRTFNKKSASVKLSVVAAPAGVSLPESIALGVGEPCTVAPAFQPSGSGGGVSFWTDDPAIAVVNAETGAISAVAPGTTTLRVRTYNGCEAACALTVKPAPESISLQNGDIALAVGDRLRLPTPSVGPEDAACGSFSYKSSNKRYVSVSQSGELTGVRAGKKATITVSTYNGQKASFTVSVQRAPSSISFAQGALSMFIGDTCTPEVKFAKSVASSYSLTSSNPEVVCVNGTSIQAVGGGTATITATSFNKKKASMTVSVPKLPDSVALSPSALALGAGDSMTIRAVMPEGQGAALSYESSDPAVAAVERVDNETITVSAIAEGSATILVRSSNGCTGAATLAVSRAPSALSVSPSVARRSLQEGQQQLELRFGGEGEGGRVNFASSDEAVATVDQSGLVRFVGVGTATISATSYNGHRASCELSVGEQPTGMRFDQSEYLVALGDTVQLPASFDQGCESYTLASSDSSVAAVSGEFVYGAQLGSATLSATSRSGLAASCTLRVVPAPTGVKMEMSEAHLVAGARAEMQMRATAEPDGVGTIYYTSSAPEIASVDYRTGVVTPHAPGDCVIRATSYNGHCAECVLHVSYLLDGVRIGIDPGHQRQANTSKERSSPKGGRSKYKVSHGTSGKATHIAEFRTNLAVGLLLRDELEKLGAEVYMTRDTHDVNISNQQRAKMMNALGVDLAIRLHCNSANSSSVNGLNIYIRKSWAYDDAELGKAVRASEASAAKAIAAHFVQATGAKNNGVHKNDNYTMNNWSTVPCLLVEMGYMSNRAEDRKLNDPDYQLKMVQGMIDGICEYMGRELPAW